MSAQTLADCRALLKKYRDIHQKILSGNIPQGSSSQELLENMRDMTGNMADALEHVLGWVGVHGTMFRDSLIKAQQQIECEPDEAHQALYALAQVWNEYLKDTHLCAIRRDPCKTVPVDGFVGDSGHFSPGHVVIVPRVIKSLFGPGAGRGVSLSEGTLQFYTELDECFFEDDFASLEFIVPKLDEWVLQSCEREAQHAT